MAQEPRIFTIFGGTGFLGRRIVRHLAAKQVKVRVASRHPDRGETIFRNETQHVEFARADINKESEIQAALAGAFGVANAVSLYVERENQTFHSVLVEAAARLARCAREAGVARLIQISGVGADPRSSSLYIRKRGEGEDAVRSAFPGAVIVRPTVMFGAGDAFLSPLVGLLRRLPALPLFGSGRTALQPSYVEDVGEAVSRVFDETGTNGLYELGGPKIYSYAELLRRIADYIAVKPLLFPLPFGAWQALATGMEMFPHPPITRNQVELMMIDNVASESLSGFKDLQVDPKGIEIGLAEVVANSK